MVGIKSGLIGAFTGIVGALAISGGASAFPLVSGDGSESCTYVSSLLSGSCSVETITAHPLWMPDDALSATWISYGPTGYQDAGPYAPRDSSAPLFRVTETFSLTGESALQMAVWADDTAEVFIDGVSVFAPNFTQNICANGSIGCEPDELGAVSAILAAGIHTVSFDVYQIGTGTSTSSNPFGLLYFGSVELTGGGTNQTPEAPALLLFAAGLLGLGLMVSRRRRDDAN